MAEKYTKQQKRKSRKSPKPQRRSRQGWENKKEIFENEELLEWLQTVRFRKVFLGGLDERDVWKKIQELNGFYEAVVRDERARYDAIIEEHKKACNAVVRKYKLELYEMEKAEYGDKAEKSGESFGKGVGR